MSGKIRQIIIIAAILVALAAAAFIFVLNGNKGDEEAKLLAAAENYYKALDYDKAIATYNRIIANNSSCADAYIGLADVYIDMGNESKASEILERGINEAKGASNVADKFKDIFGDENYAELLSPPADVTEENIVSSEESEITEPAVTEVPVDETEPEESETEETTVPTEAETTTVSVTPEVTTAAPVVYTTVAPVTTRATTRAAETTTTTTATTTVTTTVPITTTTAETTTTTASYKLNLYDPESLTIKVPNFIGQREDYVSGIAASKGITMEYIYEYNEEYASGRVFKQSFNNGDKIAPGMIMYVHVSLGSKNAKTEAPVVTTTAGTTFKSEVKLINFKGMSVKEAQKWCKQNGLSLDVTDEGEEGGSIKKQSPEAGIKVKPGTTIFVFN